MKRGFTLIYILTEKTAETGALKTPIHSVGDRYHCLESGVPWRRIIGPILFGETVIAECYSELILNFVSVLES